MYSHSTCRKAFWDCIFFQDTCDDALECGQNKLLLGRQHNYSARLREQPSLWEHAYDK